MYGYREIKNFKVKVISGRFKGSTGTVTDIYGDGVYGIDVDRGFSVNGRAFATEKEIERIEVNNV